MKMRLLISFWLACAGVGFGAVPEKVQSFMEQVAYLARKLDAAQEGERTLLDNTMLMHCSSMMISAKHNNDELPVIVFGGGLKGVRMQRLTEKPERQLCRLFMSMMDKMDVRPKTFGDTNLILEKI